MYGEAFDYVHPIRETRPKARIDDIRENLNSLAQSIELERKINRRAAEITAVRIFDVPETEWHVWATDPPKESDGIIVGRDCLNFLHLATHLVGAKDSMWCDHWIPLSAIAKP